MGRSPESLFPFASCSTPVEQAQEAVEEENAVPIPQIRRKSSSWKGFNLKRQLSKVDIKLKYSLKEKRGSIFYADPSLEQHVTDTSDNHEKSSPESDDHTVIDNQSVVDLTIKNEETTKSSENVSESIQLSPDDETELQFIVGSLGSQLEYFNNRKVGFAVRPDNLNLGGTESAPVRPPRSRKKQQEQRDQRLLSVPNIKFLRFDNQSLKDLRDKEECAIVSPQPSFTGNFMRRFSKFYN